MGSWTVVSCASRLWNAFQNLLESWSRDYDLWLVTKLRTTLSVANVASNFDDSNYEAVVISVNVYKYDHCQIYIATPRQATRLTGLLAVSPTWLSASRLRLNPTTTPVMWFGSKHLVTMQLRMCQSWRHQSLWSTQTVVWSMAINSCITMAGHVSAICLVGQLRPIVWSLTANANQDSC